MMGDGDEFDEDHNLQVNVVNFDNVPYDEESIRQMFAFHEDDLLEEFENISCESASCDDLYYSPIFSRVRGQMSLNIDEFKYHPRYLQMYTRLMQKVEVYRFIASPKNISKRKC